MLMLHNSCMYIQHLVVALMRICVETHRHTDRQKLYLECRLKQFRLMIQLPFHNNMLVSSFYYHEKLEFLIVLLFVWNNAGVWHDRQRTHQRGGILLLFRLQFISNKDFAYYLFELFWISRKIFVYKFCSLNPKKYT